MKKFLILSMLIVTPILSFSQLMDLIVTTSGDSIACEIDSVTDSHIYFEMKDRNNWVHTEQFLDKIVKYEQNSIDKKSYIFVPGSTRILPVTDVDLHKALKLQKTGRTLNIIGGSILGGTVATIAGVAITDQGDWALGAVVIAFFGGLASLSTFAVGIPMNLTGKKRVEKINAMKNSAFNQINLDLKPSQQYNIITQKYQPGVTLKIRF